LCAVADAHTNREKKSNENPRVVGANRMVEAKGKVKYIN
jgi:hypothetical protein